MKKITLAACIMAIALVTSCSKSSDDSTPPNPLAAVNGNWKNTVWGGVSNNDIIINISQSSRTGVIQSLGAQTFNYTAGETILSNITATSNANVFTSNGIFKYGAGNTNVANTTVTLTLLNNGQQLEAVYAPANGVTPATYVYTRQ